MMNHDTQNVTKNEENEAVTPLQVFTIYDRKLKKHLPPFLCSCQEDAIRQFSSLVNYTNSLICKFPDDYYLKYLCDFDDTTGEFIIFDHETFVIEAKALKTDETIRYDELLKEIKGQKTLVDSAISDYNNIHQMYSAKIRDLESRIQAIKEPALKSSKKSFLDRLFN